MPEKRKFVNGFKGLGELHQKITDPKNTGKLEALHDLAFQSRMHFDKKIQLQARALLAVYSGRHSEEQVKQEAKKQLDSRGSYTQKFISDALESDLKIDLKNKDLEIKENAVEDMWRLLKEGLLTSEAVQRLNKD